MGALPVWNGWTVDMRLRQFRKGIPETGMTFIDFDSPEGAELLNQMFHESFEAEEATGEVKLS